MFKTNCWVRLHNTLSPAIVLLLLVWITPTAAEPTSYNDPFHAIALRAPRPADPPICCLKPLPPLEPVEDDLLLSFEEWKARQHHTSENASSTSASGGSGNESGNGQGNGSESLKVEDATSPPPAAQEDHQPHAPAQTPETIFQLPPHFRVPLVDRFNYASLDCSARVHKAHKGAKHPANILSSKKDRYMLSPCKTKEQQFVVIELCEDIRIDTVQLANFEFFSGVFKDITVSVAKTSSEEENWTVAGSWKAKNVRGVQSFHPPLSLRGFYRYLRIDFHSHYGSEYYCPVSLVRVYGLTHLEEWKWELWEAESKTKPEATPQDAQMDRATETINNSGRANETGAVVDTTQTVEGGRAMPSTSVLPINETGEGAAPSSATLTETPSHSTDTYLSSPQTITQPPDLEVSYPLSSSISTISTSSPSSSTFISSVYHTTVSSQNATPTPMVPHNNTNTTNLSTTASHVLASPSPARTSSPSIVLTPTPIAASQPFLPVPVPGGESIFRIIMNRLVGLERNHTLYEQYMAQQQLVVRDALKRLGEDIGRLEGLGKAQRQAHDRTVLEWEKQRKQWQMEHAQLLQMIDYLSDEIIMEKRLGVAQLCLLLAVLVFMGLTRGSRGPIIEDRRHWKTTLKSLSGDWRRPQRRESEDLWALKRDGNRVEFPKTAPSILPIRAVDSGSAVSTGDMDATVSAPPRYPLTELEPNTVLPHRNQQARRRGGENYRSENVQNVYFDHNGSGTFSHTRSRTASRSRSRTSSWTGKGVFVHPGLAQNTRQVTEARSVANTPSKGSRVAGVYSPRPAFASIRTSTYMPNPRRAIPLQRSHSSHGPPGSIDYVLGQTWAGSGGALKSARKWARTAHLHEVKGKRREDGSGSLYSDSLNGDNATEVGHDGGGADGSDVFGNVGHSQTPNEGPNGKRVKLSILGNADADADADGWESASDVEVDSVDGI